MAAYLAKRIELGKLDYADVVAKYPEYKPEIDGILSKDGRQELIKEKV